MENSIPAESDDHYPKVGMGYFVEVVYRVGKAVATDRYIKVNDRNVF